MSDPAGDFGVDVPGHTLLSRLGRGGMASVYLAREERLGRLVAVKVIDERFERDAQFRARFEREARTAAALTHPNIVPVYQFGFTADERPFLTMAYLDGGSLRDRLRARGALPVDEALSITRQVADALRAAHTRNIVHRDLKPDNVLFNGGTAMLTDFGIAKVLDAATELTVTGANPGTVRYFSPEQANERPVDARSDIYTLGVVLYEMLTGRAPIEGESLVQLMVRIVQQPPEPLPAALRGLQPFMDLLLAKDPDDRLGSCTDVIAVIHAMERNWLRFGELDRITDGVALAPTRPDSAITNSQGAPADDATQLFAPTAVLPSNTAGSAAAERREPTVALGGGRASPIEAAQRPAAPQASPAAATPRRAPLLFAAVAALAVGGGIAAWVSRAPAQATLADGATASSAASAGDAVSSTAATLPQAPAAIDAPGTAPPSTVPDTLAAVAAPQVSSEPARASHAAPAPTHDAPAEPKDARDTAIAEDVPREQEREGAEAATPVPQADAPPPRSLPSNHPVNVTFENHLRVQVRLMWIDFDGNAKFYAFIEPGGRVEQPTYSGHLWRVMHGRRPVGSYRADASAQQTYLIAR